MKIPPATLIVFLVPLLGACEDATAGENLPPAKGEGAPPAPEFPALESLSQEVHADSRATRFVGSLHSKERVEVAAEISGTLAEVNYDVGDEVDKGDVLFRLKAQNAKLSLTQSRKGLEAARRRLAQAQRELDRINELFAAGAATEAQRDGALNAYDNAAIAVEQAEVAVDMGRSGFGDTRTRAPIAGTVVDRFKDPGEAVTSMPPTVVLVVEDLSTLEVRVRVPEFLLRRIDKGTQLRAHVPALGMRKDITVARLGSSVDPATRTIEVIANVENADLRLKPGMSVEVIAPSTDGGDEGKNETHPSAEPRQAEAKAAKLEDESK